MTTIEYLSLPLHKRIFHRILSFIVSIPIAIGNFFKDKFVGFFVLLFAVLWLFTQPVLLIIAIVVLVLIVIAFSAK